MNKLYGYFCPVCGHVEITTTRTVGKYHRGTGITGWKTHAMLEAGAYRADMGLDAIKAEILAQDWNGGVREIESVSTEVVGVRYERATQPRVRRVKQVRC